MTDPIPSAAPSLIDRVKAILLNPAQEWPRIAAEDTPTREIFLRYVVPLTLIAPLAGFIGGQLFGMDFLIASYKPGFFSALIMAIVTFVLGLINVLLMTLIVDFLSPKFGGEANNFHAFKLVAYGATAAWVSGIFGLIPALSFLGIVGLYSIYLFYTGATPLLKVPKEKAATFTVVVIVCAALLNFVVYGLGRANMSLLAGMGLMGDAPAESGTITLPGGKTIETGEMENLGKQMEDMASGKTKAVEGAKLQALLPETVGAYRRTASEMVSLGQVGSSAEGTYEAGDKRFTLKVTDLSAAGAFAAMGAAMGIEQSREDADSYERTTTVGGNLQTEAWNRSSGSGKFGTVIAKRFLVEADGNASSIDDLKAAVAAIDAGDLAALGK